MARPSISAIKAQLEALRGGTIGMIFQEPMAALDPCFTVGHHLAEVIRLHRGGSRADIEKQIIALVASGADCQP